MLSPNNINKDLLLEQIRRFTFREQTPTLNTLDQQAALLDLFPIARDKRTSYQIGDLGSWSGMPNEIIRETLLILDLVTLVAFRGTNRLAMEHVDNIPAYKTIVNNCPNIIRAIITVKATSYNLETLFAKLCETKCEGENCENFGAFLYVITCKRVCFKCFTTDPAFFPLGISDAYELTGLKRDELQHIPHIKTLHGFYGPQCHCNHLGGLELYDRNAILPIQRFPPSAMTLFADSHADSPSLLGPINPRRFNAIAAAPVLKKGETDFVDWGFHCAACAKVTAHLTISRKTKYTEQYFCSHLAVKGIITEFDGQPVHLIKTQNEG